MAKAPKPLVAGNWKMNGLKGPGLVELRKLHKKAKAVNRLGCEVLICPPAPLFGAIPGELRRGKLAFGGQDCHANVSGAHTGDVSAQMLADVGCKYVIVGHSERRADHGESSKVVCAKAEAVHAAGLIAIICIGETARERKAGDTLKVVGAQLKGSVPAGATPANSVIAYEPVWAIGTGLTPTTADVAAVHKSVRARLNRRFDAAGPGFRILYGGSVKASNAVELMAVANVDGALVGGASLTAADFWPIVEAKL
jgi:triosephosphate isomerase